MKSQLTYGAISAIASAIFSLVMFFLGFQTEKLQTGQHVQWLGLIVFGVILFLGMRDVRENKPNKAISYGQALGAAFMISLFAGIFSAVYNYIHLSFINTNYAQYMADFMRTNLEAQNVPSEQVDAIVAAQGKMMSPAIQSGLMVIMTPIMGTIFGLILAIFVKKAAPADPIKAS